LISELYEETGIHNEAVISAAPFALVHDKLKGGYDICIKLQLKGEALSQTSLNSREYASLIWKDKEELKAIAKKKTPQNNWVPLSIYLIDKFL
nr:hypothetical protein [Parachlamydiaceae bacterium]